MTTTHQRAVPPADAGLQQPLAGLSAVRSGDFSTRLPADGDPLMDEIASVFNGMNDQLALFTSEVTRVAREVGTEGRLGGQAQVPGVGGTWKDLTDSVNSMAGNLTGQVRDVARVATAVARGDLSQKISVDVKGEMLELKDTLNTMVDELSAFADEVTRVAREVGTEGRLGGQARVPGVGGTWRDLTDSVNSMAGNLTGQVRNIAQVTTAVARGDLSQKISVEAKGEVATLVTSEVNTASCSFMALKTAAISSISGSPASGSRVLKSPPRTAVKPASSCCSCSGCPVCVAVAMKITSDSGVRGHARCRVGRLLRARMSVCDGSMMPLRPVPAR